MSNEIVGAQYVYVTIPKSDVKLYHRLMSLMADYGEAKLKDCTAECLRNNQLVINAYNMFNAALAAKKTNDALYRTLIKYVEATIDNLYKGQNDDDLSDIGFIYESDVDENVIIDIERSVLITQDGMWSIVPYTEPLNIEVVRYTIDISSTSIYSDIEYTGGTLSKNSNPSYSVKKTITYDDGSSTGPIADSPNIQIKYSSDTLTVDENTGKITGVSQSSNTSRHIIGTVTATITILNPDDKAEPNTLTADITYTIYQKAYNNYNIIHSCIPITDTQAELIIGGDLDINTLFESDEDIQTHITNLFQNYKLDDGNASRHDDELQLTVPTDLFFIEIFLLSTKTHRIMNYVVFGGQEVKTNIVDVRYDSNNLNTKYETNDRTYLGASYKMIAILRMNDINKTILIQQEQ